MPSMRCAACSGRNRRTVHAAAETSDCCMYTPVVHVIHVIHPLCRLHEMQLTITMDMQMFLFLWCPNTLLLQTLCASCRMPSGCPTGRLWAQRPSAPLSCKCAMHTQIWHTKWDRSATSTGTCQLDFCSHAWVDHQQLVVSHTILWAVFLPGFLKYHPQPEGVQQQFEALHRC